jgi:hypothetical protein
MSAHPYKNILSSISSGFIEEINQAIEYALDRHVVFSEHQCNMLNTHAFAVQESTDESWMRGFGGPDLGIYDAIIEFTTHHRLEVTLSQTAVNRANRIIGHLEYPCRYSRI